MPHYALCVSYFCPDKTHSYYIRTKLDSTPKPLLLIPQLEVEELFREIKSTFGIDVRFPDVTIDDGFQLGFQYGPRPRYLGRLTSHCGVLELEAMIPIEGSAVEEFEQLDEKSFPLFRAKMQAAILSSKNKNRAARDRRRKDHVETKKRWCAELKRCQTYLGLRPQGTLKQDDFIVGLNMSWEESQKAQQDYEIAAGITLPLLDTTSPSPYPFHRNVVFICVDIESYERDHNKITEIGVSTLDTLDIIKIPPGTDGEVWINQIRCRHFRVVEHAHLNNSDFIAGCADRFEAQFGQSEWISIREAPQVIASCFKPPFSAPGQYTRHPSTKHEVPRYGSNIQPLVEDNPVQKRNIVLVGHETRSDIDYLLKIGYDVGNLSNVIEAIDTANLFRAHKHEQNPRTLGAILLELQLVGWNLHNAGNDAAYTTQALIGICLDARKAPNKPPRQPTEEQLDEAAAEAQARLIEESDEWKAAEEEDGDGGAAVAVLSAADREFESALAKGRKADERREIRRARREPAYTGHGGPGRTGRASRHEGYGRGRNGPGGGGKRGSATKQVKKEEEKEEETESMPFNFEAMDEAMGVGDGDGTVHWANASWDWAGDETAGGATSSSTTTTTTTTKTGSAGTDTTADLIDASTESAVSPPPKQQQQSMGSGDTTPSHPGPVKPTTKQALAAVPEKPKVVMPRISSKMVERLKILDGGGL